MYSALTATRPDVCRTWFCLWRRIEAIPEQLRPDKIGVVFSLDQHLPPRILFENIYIVGRAIADPSALDSAEAKSLVDMFASEGSLPVWLSYDGQKRLVYPPQELASAIVDPAGTPYQNLVAEAFAWRKRYGVD